MTLTAEENRVVEKANSCGVGSLTASEGRTYKAAKEKLKTNEKYNRTRNVQKRQSNYSSYRAPTYRWRWFRGSWGLAMIGVGGISFLWRLGVNKNIAEVASMDQNSKRHLRRSRGAGGDRVWFGVRTIVMFEAEVSGQQRVYEERIVLISATDADDAMAQARSDTERYARNVGGAPLRILQSYQIDELILKEPCEVFSLMRESDLAPDNYLDRMFDTGTERQRTQAFDDDDHS